MTKKPYIGPERRNMDRRGDRFRFVVDDRRIEERRQEATAGIIVGLDAYDMQRLALVWEGLERLEKRRKGGYSSGASALHTARS